MFIEGAVVCENKLLVFGVAGAAVNGILVRLVFEVLLAGVGGGGGFTVGRPVGFYLII